MKDMNGVTLKTGDLMAENTGGGCWDGKSFTSVSFWEVPGTREGGGTIYTSKGKKTYYYWADAEESVKIDVAKLPEGFLYAFRHGLCHIDVEYEYSDIYEAIVKSDWKKNALTPDDVENLAAISKINISKFADIYDNWDALFSFGRLPAEAIDKIMSLFKYSHAIAINGEIGMAAIQDHSVFVSVYGKMEAMKENGTLKEWCDKQDA